MSTPRATLFVLVATVLSGNGLVRADTVVLRNHVEYRGAIMSEDPGQITILSDGSEWTFPRDTIARVQRDAVSAAEERARDKRRRAAALRARVAQDTPAPPVRKPAAEHVETASLAAINAQGVTVYGTSWCGYCKKARAFFLSRGVPFADKDIETDRMADMEMHRKCAAAGVYPSGVPVIDVFGTMVPGFDERRIDDLLKSHGY